MSLRFGQHGEAGLAPDLSKNSSTPQATPGNRNPLSALSPGGCSHICERWGNQLSGMIQSVLGVDTELDRATSPEERCEIWRAARAEVRRSAWRIELILAGFVGAEILLFDFLLISDANSVAAAVLLAGYFFGLSPGVGWFALRIQRKRHALAIRRAFARRGSPVCVCCGYDLRGTDGRCCSECGATIPHALGDLGRRTQTLTCSWRQSEENCAAHRGLDHDFRILNPPADLDK